MTLCYRSILAVSFLVAPAGCTDGGSSRSGTIAPATRGAEDEWRRYDDPRFSAHERQAVRAATEAVLDPKRPRPDFDQAFRYGLSKHDGEWFVIVWHVYGFKEGKPQLVPGGHTGVSLDVDFKAKSVMPGA